jgi:hypothetical protein
VEKKMLTIRMTVTQLGQLADLARLRKISRGELCRRVMEHWISTQYAEEINEDTPISIDMLLEVSS